VKDKDRGTGRTTAQMKAAPKGAIFVWCNPCLNYPRQLAKGLDRIDLVIIPPSLLEEHRWKGLRLTGLVVDHDTRLTEEQAQTLERMRAMIR